MAGPGSNQALLPHGLWSKSLEFFQLTKKYTLKGGTTCKIHMPFWIADGEYETTLPSQSQLVKDALGDRAELHLVNGYHHQTLNGITLRWRGCV